MRISGKLIEIQNAPPQLETDARGAVGRAPLAALLLYSMPSSPTLRCHRAAKARDGLDNFGAEAPPICQHVPAGALACRMDAHIK